VRGSPTSLATLSTCGAAVLVLLLFAPALQAPFLAPKWFALELTASLGLTAFALESAATGRPRWSRSVSIGALLVLVTTALSWAAASRSAPGAPYAVAATARWASLFGLACGTSVIADVGEARWRVLSAVTIAAAAVATLGLLQHLDLVALPIPVISTPGSTFGNRNFAAEVMALALPLGVAAAAEAPPGARTAIWTSLALELVFLAVTRTRGAWIAAAIGLGTAVWWIGVRLSRASTGIAMVVLVVAALAASVPGHFNPRDAGDAKRYAGVTDVLRDGIDAHSTALRTRLGLWRRTLMMINDYPLFGVGPGNWPVLFPRYAEPGALKDGVLTATRVPRQVHNDPLERAVETGLPGLMALGVLVAGAANAVRARLRSGDKGARAVAAGAGGALMALGALSIGSFPLEMPGTLALGGLALGLVATDPQREAQSSRLARTRMRTIAVLAGATVLVTWVVVRATRNVQASRWLGVAERAMRHDRGSAGAAYALAALQRSLAAAPGDYRAEIRSAQMLLRENRFAESATAVGRALEVEPYAPSAWAALAAADLAAGKAEVARTDATEAIDLLEDYPLALSVRARAAEQMGDDVSAKADRGRIERLAADTRDDDTARMARELLLDGFD
jgi:O-antigen ligase